MHVKKIQELLTRDLEVLKKEIDLFESEDQLWVARDTINNSAGNLVLHLCGNLRHFIGAVLGDTGYVRDRDAEFNDKNVPVNELIALVNSTMMEVSATLEAMDDEALDQAYPTPFPNGPEDTFQMLVHLHGHLNYHLGQINYYRRLH